MALHTDPRPNGPIKPPDWNPGGNLGPNGKPIIDGGNAGKPSGGNISFGENSRYEGGTQNQVQGNQQQGFTGPTQAEIDAQAAAAAAAAERERIRQENENKRRADEAKRRADQQKKSKQQEKPAQQQATTTRTAPVLSSKNANLEASVQDMAAVANEVPARPSDVMAETPSQGAVAAAAVDSSGNVSEVTVDASTGEIMADTALDMSVRQPAVPSDVASRQEARRAPTIPASRPADVGAEIQQDLSGETPSEPDMPFSDAAVSQMRQETDYRASRTQEEPAQQIPAEPRQPRQPKSQAPRQAPDVNPKNVKGPEAPFRNETFGYDRYKNQSKRIKDEYDIDHEPPSKEKINNAVDNVARWLKRGHFKTDGVFKNKKGKWVMSKTLRPEFEKTMRFFNAKPEEAHFLFQMVSHLDGLAPDTNDKLFNKGSSAKVKVNEKKIIEAWAEIREKMSNPNVRQPFAYTNPNKNYAGSYRFPVPFVTAELAVFMAKASPGLVTAKDIAGFAEGEWEKNIYPALQLRGETKQKQSILLLVDAVEKINGTKMNYAHRTPDGWFTIDDALSEQNDWAMIFEDIKYLQEFNALKPEQQRKYAAEADRRGKKVTVDKDGNIVSIRDIVDNPGSWLLRMTVKLAKALALFNPVLGVAAAVEHTQSNLTSMLGGRMMRAAFGTDPVTDKTRETAKSQQVLDAIDDLFGAYASGNRAILQNHLASGGHIGGKVATETIREMMSKMSMAEKAKYATETGVNKFSELGYKVASGRFVLKDADAMRFVEYLQLGMMRAEGSTMTPELFEQMFTSDPVGFIEKMMQYPAGNDALLFAMDNTVGAANIYTEWIQRQMAKSGLNEFMISVFISKFVEYGINLTGKIMPFTHMFNYCVTQGFVKNSQNKTQMENLVIGGNDSFWTGFYKNMILDIAWLGTRGGMFIIANVIVAALGIEPPDDEDKIYVYGEWKIGGKAIEDNWMIRDVLGFCMPAVIATHAQLQGYDGFKVFQGGFLNTMSGLPTVKIADMAYNMANWDRLLMESKEEIEEQWGDEAPSESEKAYVETATWGLMVLASWFDAPVSRTLYNEAGIMNQNALQHSVTKVYAPTDDDPDATVRTTWADAQFRSVARWSPLVADLLNFVNGVDPDDPERTKTGYRKDQMPLVEIRDPAQSFWAYQKFHIDDETTPEEMIAISEEVIRIISEYDDPRIIAAMGVCIPYQARQNTVDYLGAQINAIINERADRLATPGEFSGNGKSWEENNLAKQQLFEESGKQIQILKQIQNRLWDSRIPYSPSVYNQWQTDWRTSYKWNDSGEPATEIEYYLNPGKIERTLFASGDHKSSILPFLEVDDRYNTYDAQTPVQWQDSLTDIEAMRELYGDATVEGGIYDGQKIIDILTAQGKTLEGNGENWNNTLLTGQRALVPEAPDYKKTKLLDPNRDDAWNPLGDIGKAREDQPDAYKAVGGGYSGYRGGYSRGGGGGGSSYNPNIYSRPAYSLNADKPATMYAKIPSYSRFDYLRPGFETKGSREAYKRQDI